MWPGPQERVKSHKVGTAGEILGNRFQETTVEAKGKQILVSMKERTVLLGPIDNGASMEEGHEL